MFSVIPLGGAEVAVITDALRIDLLREIVRDDRLLKTNREGGLRAALHWLSFLGSWEIVGEDLRHVAGAEEACGLFRQIASRLTLGVPTYVPSKFLWVYPDGTLRVNRANASAFDHVARMWRVTPTSSV